MRKSLERYNQDHSHDQEGQGDSNREALFPGSPIIAAGIYGEELKLLAKAGHILKKFKATKSNAAGTETLMKWCALTFKFSGRCMGRRRLQALRVEGSEPSESLRHGATRVLQAGWRLCMAKVKHGELKCADKDSMVPIAVALIQIYWRVSLQTLSRRRRRKAYKAERKAVATRKAISVVQKAIRNRWDRAKITRVRNVFRGEILAFAAVKVQIAWRKNYMRRLKHIAMGDDGDSDNEFEDGDDEGLPSVFGITNPKQAKVKREQLLLQHKNDLSIRIAELQEVKQGIDRTQSTQALAAKKKETELLEKKRLEFRPISFRVLGCQQVPLPPGAMSNVMQSDLFFVVSALPSPPPAECLIGGETAAASAASNKRRGSATALMMGNTVAANGESKVQRAACFSMPAKSVHTSTTEHSRGAVDGINVIWKQEVTLNGETFDGRSTLVFTLLRRPPKKSGVLTSSSGFRDEFVGQATIKLGDLPDLWSTHDLKAGASNGGSSGGGGVSSQANRNGGEVTVDLKLGELKCRVWDGKGNKLKFDKKEWSGGGQLRISFIRQDDQSLFNGWLKTSTLPPSQIASIDLKTTLKSGNVMERRWVLLTNNRLSIHETYYCEPDIEIALETIKSCRVDAQNGFLYVDFDRVEASKCAIKRGRGTGTGGAAQGISQGSFGFGTGPSNLKVSIAIQNASSLTGVLILAVGSGGNELSALRKCIEKALFLRSHGDIIK